jgi:tetratricopeptide (TPR) repeat protein
MLWCEAKAQIGNSAPNCFKITEAESYIDRAQKLLQTLHLPPGTSADDFIRNKRNLEVSLSESAGFVELESKRYDAAIRDYEWVLEHATTPSPIARLRVGLAYYYVGKQDAARAQLEQATLSGSDIVRRRAEEILRALAGSSG